MQKLHMDVNPSGNLCLTCPYMSHPLATLGTLVSGLHSWILAPSVGGSKLVETTRSPKTKICAGFKQTNSFIEISSWLLNHSLAHNSCNLQVFTTQFHSFQVLRCVQEPLFCSNSFPVMVDFPSNHQIISMIICVSTWSISKFLRSD